MIIFLEIQLKMYKPRNISYTLPNYIFYKDLEVCVTLIIFQYEVFPSWPCDGSLAVNSKRAITRQIQTRSWKGQTEDRRPKWPVIISWCPCLCIMDLDVNRTLHDRASFAIPALVVVSESPGGYTKYVWQVGEGSLQEDDQRWYLTMAHYFT